MKRKVKILTAILVMSTLVTSCNEPLEKEVGKQVLVKSPVVEIIEEEIKIEDATQEPVVEIIDEEIQIEDATQEPVVEIIDEEIQIEDVIQEPVVEIIDEEIQIEDVTQEPVVEIIEEEIQVEEVIQEPVVEIIEKEIQVEEVTQEQTQENLKLLAEDTPVTVSTQNIEYTFHETNFNLVKKIPIYMAEYFPSDSNGNLNDNFNAVVTTITFKNLSNASNTFMLNSTSLRPVEDGKATAYVNDMRYFSNINSNSKRNMQYTLEPNEEITFEVAFCVSDFFNSISNENAIVVNPDGTNPINENARVVPVNFN